MKDIAFILESPLCSKLTLANNIIWQKLYELSDDQQLNIFHLIKKSNIITDTEMHDNIQIAANECWKPDTKKKMLQWLDELKGKKESSVSPPGFGGNNSEK